MGNSTVNWINGAPGLLKMLPWVIAVFSGSAGGAVTVAALQTQPLSVNEIVRSETKVLAAIENHGKELERIYGALGALDDRQREMHTDINTLKVVTNLLQRKHDASN